MDFFDSLERYLLIPLRKSNGAVPFNGPQHSVETSALSKNETLSVSSVLYGVEQPKTRTRPHNELCSRVKESSQKQIMSATSRCLLF
jgi:hypothetical protein